MSNTIYYDLFFSATDLSLVDKQRDNKRWNRTEDPEGDPYNEILSGAGARDWKILVSELTNELLPYGGGEFVLTINLSKKESDQLTLGISQNNGGDFTQDRDFGMDIETFFDTYRNIPKRIKTILNDLPGNGNRNRRRWRISSEIGLEVF
jgi:hypothetical protein